LKKRKIRAITAFKVIQGHRGGYQSKARMRLLLVINSNWHPISRTVSNLSQLTVQISDTLRFRATLWGLRDNARCSSWAHCKARSGLPINVNWTFFAKCYGWVATSEKRSKIGDFAPTRSLWSKISGRRGRSPPIIFTRL